MERLQEIGEPAVVPLIAALEDPQRSSILHQRAIGMFPEFIEDTRVIRPLIALLRNENVEVRWEAATALGNLQAESAVPELEYIAKHDKGVFFPMPGWRESVSEAAAEAVEKIRSGSRQKSASGIGYL